MADYDIIIAGGTVYDGDGGSPQLADVAIRDGVIMAVGTSLGTADEEIDATDKLVTPGFIDVHTHYDGQATWEHTLAPSSGHGVTTVIMGNCGVGFAPCRPEQRNMLVKVMEGVEDVPEVVMTEGLPWNWETFPEYLDALDLRTLDIDVAAQLPHSALRVYVMGDRAASHEPPTAEDLNDMRRLTKEAMKAGAIGVSTSRNMMHRTKAGDLAPSLFSEEDELKALGEGLRDAGRGVFQIIPSMEKEPADEFRLMRRVAEVAQRPLSYTLLQLPTGSTNAFRESLNLLEQAVEAGLPMRAQVAPRAVGALFGLDLSFHPFTFHPSFKTIAHLPLNEKVARMRDPEFRARLLSETPEDVNPINLHTVAASRSAYPLCDPPNYEPQHGERFDIKAEALGLDLDQYLYDLLLEQDGHAMFYLPGANYRDGNLDAVREMIGHPYSVMGLADGGAHYGIICDASFPTFYLQHWARDADPKDRVSLPQAVAELSGKPADLVGLKDRGRLKPGYKADVNVIDLQALKAHAPRVKRDLPAGGKRLSQQADGYVATIVSGQVTYRGGVATGALPGRLVRGQQEAPIWFK